MIILMHFVASLTATLLSMVILNAVNKEEYSWSLFTDSFFWCTVGSVLFRTLLEV